VIKALRDTDYRDKDSFFKMIQLLKGLAVASENDKTAKAYMDKVSDALTSIGGKTESMDLGESKLDKELEKRLLAYVKKHGLKTKGEVMSAMIKMAPKWMEEIGYSVVVGDKLGKIGESVDLDEAVANMGAYEALSDAGKELDAYSKSLNSLEIELDDMMDGLSGRANNDARNLKKDVKGMYGDAIKAGKELAGIRNGLNKIK